MWAKPLAGESDGVKEDCDGGRRFTLFTGKVVAVFCFRELLKGQDGGRGSAAALLVSDTPPLELLSRITWQRKPDGGEW